MKFAFPKLIVSVFAFCLLSLVSISASAQECDQVLAGGIFNTTAISSNAAFARTLNEFIYASDFSSHQQAVDAGLSIGTVVFGVPLKLGGSFSNQQKDEWRRKNIQYKTEASQSSYKLDMLFKYASPEVLETWLRCKEITQARPGLSSYIQEINNSSAVLHLNWVPSAGDEGGAPVILSSSITGGSRADNASKPILPDGYKLLQGQDGNLVALIKRPEQVCVVVINTTRGATTCFLRALPKPSIMSFTPSASSINEGETANLIWATSRATTIAIDPGIGDVQQNGSVNVTPRYTTTYKLTAANSSGKINAYATVSVTPLPPPPPVLTGGTIYFRTTNDNKDDDTNVSVYIKSAGNTAAQWSTSGREEWRDNSDHGPYSFTVIQPAVRKDQIVGPGQAVLVEAPNGHDEWHFNWSITLTFSDGTTKRYDWDGGNVDHDRTTISKPLP